MQEKLKFHVEQTTSGEIIYREDHTMLGAMPETLIFKTRKELADYINPQVAEPAAPPYPSNQAQASAMNINAANAANTAGLASKQLNMQNSAFNANDYYPHNLPKRCNDGTVFKSKEDSKPPVKPEIAAMAEFAVKCGYGGRFKEFSLALAGIGYLADECLKEQANPQGDKE